MDFPSSLQFKSKIRRVTVCPIENPFNQKLLQNVFWQLRLEGTIKLDTDMNPSSITDHNFAYFENSLDFFKNLTETILVLIFWVSQSSLAASIYFEPWGGKFIKKTSFRTSWRFRANFDEFLSLLVSELLRKLNTSYLKKKREKMDRKIKVSLII